MTEPTVQDRPLHQIPPHVPPGQVHEFDLLDDPRARVDAHGLFSELHRTAPDIFYAPGRQAGWVVRPLSMIIEVLQKPELFSSKGQFATLAQVVGGEFGLIPLEVDPPSHLKYRMLLNPIFSPKRVAAMEGRIRQLAAELVDRFAAKGHCDIVADYAQILPTTIFADILGLPQERVPDYVTWTRQVIQSYDPKASQQAVFSIISELRELIADRMKTPRNDLLSLIVTSEVKGERLNDKELLGFAFLLFIAGLDTVASAMSNIFAFLARNPKARRELVKAPERIRAATEEMLRAYSPVTLGRTATQDIEFHGASIRKGDHVRCLLPLGNRDPAVFEEPETVDFDRAALNHIVFGAGPHRCLGSHLARMELEIAIEEFLKRIPEFEIAPGESLTMHAGVLGFDAVPLSWKVRG